MAIEVPDEPKKYTTVYDGFKGVDFTNDPSNVYKRRSPSGKNMLPDIDGRPYKRTGWKVEYSAEDFITAASSAATTVTPKRIHHFSLGGADYLMIFNSLGVFYTNENMTSVVKCQLASYDSNDNIVTSAFPPTVDGVALEADSGRTFFFEANGVAGLYTFVGTKLFRFDGQYYWEVDPYIPVILIACDANGTGTMLDNINLLTTQRTVQYQCDGTTTGFIIPSGIDTDKTYTVETMTLTGEWEAQTSGDTYTWSYSNGVLTFSPAPAVVIDGEDNMRVTYYPSNVYASTTALTDTATATRYTYWTENEDWGTMPYRTSEGTPRSYEQGTDTYTNVSVVDVPATFTLENPVNINDVVITPTGGTTTTNAYDSTITYVPSEDDLPTRAAGYVPNSRMSYELNITEVILYCSSSYVTIYRAWQNDDFSSCTTVGTYTTEDAAIAAAETYQNNSSTTYYFVYRCPNAYTETRRATSSASCTIAYDSYIYATSDDDDTIGSDKSAFINSKRATVYGSGLVNQVFIGASTSNGYRSRLWYSAVGQPNYFPDINYVEVGANDTAIMGMIKCDEYLGIIKAGNALDSSIYLAYPTSFDDDTTYVVKQSVAGIGALSMGAFNTLSEEPVFLSAEGVMAIEFNEDNNRLRNRSYYVDKKLTAETGLANAFSYVYKNMYHLSVNNHCYVLDGSQKNSWANERTNLQYEAYYLDNVPAQCFADMGGLLYFTDYKGNLCRFKTTTDTNPYRDEYMVGYTEIDADDVTGSDGNDTLTVAVGDLEHSGTAYTADELSVGMMVHFTTADSYFSITKLTDTTITLNKGVPVHAIWNTIADDDGAVHFFKNLNKKGFVLSLLPGSSSGVKVSFKPDEKEAILYGVTDAAGNILPYDYFVRKKIKKYKRLQIICENDGLDQSFGIDQIVKTYTVGNYSKNRG